MIVSLLIVFFVFFFAVCLLKSAAVTEGNQTQENSFIYVSFFFHFESFILSIFCIYVEIKMAF